MASFFFIVGIWIPFSKTALYSLPIFLSRCSVQHEYILEGWDGSGVDGSAGVGGSDGVGVSNVGDKFKQFSSFPISHAFL